MLEQPRHPHYRGSRSASLSIHIPSYAPPSLSTTPSTATATKMSYHRQLSPGGRRIQNPGRVSDSFTDAYYPQNRHNSYTSPRTSTSGVIPISKQTFVTVSGGGQQPQSTARESRVADRMYDSYSGRPRRSSLVDVQRSSAPSITQLPSRPVRPTVVQNDFTRPTSPPKFTRQDFYVTPATSAKEPRKTEHKKLYSIDSGTAKLVADVDMSGGGERHHRRRDSIERSGHRGSGLTSDRERDRGRRGYHVTGAHGSRMRDKSIDDEDAYSYTDPAGMYRDTEPRWREARPRRGSVDRGGASRERSVTQADPVSDPRTSMRDIGPPPSVRGWDKIHDVSRTRSVREPPRNYALSPTRTHYLDVRDPYYVPPRTSSRDGRNRANSTDNRSSTVHHDRPAERYDEYIDYNRDSRRERRPSVTRRPDPSIERRGFGIRSSSRDDYGRGSDESFERVPKYPRDSGYVETSHRRETALDPSHLDMPRRKEEEARAYDREYDRRDRGYEDRETERERDRQRMMERELEREPRHHNRRETGDRDRDYRKENGETVSQPGLTQVASGGLAGVAAAFGLNKVFSKDKDRDSDKERERERERERDRGYERDAPRERERDRERDRYEQPPRPVDRDRRIHEPQRDHGSHSEDSAPFDRGHRDPYAEQEPGLGFAFEKRPEPPKPAPPVERRDQYDGERDRGQERDLERDHDDTGKLGAQEMPKPAIDAEEDYRRRMEQVQRELGRASDDRQGSSDSDADRERRRREREQRQREKEERQLREPKLDAGVGITNAFESTAPPPQLRNFDAESQSTAHSRTTEAERELKRKPSILDEPMYNEPAQIIDNSLSEKRENRVRIVDPPTEEEEKKPKSILKKPTEKFPEEPNAVREGVAPLKDVRAW